MLVAGVSCEVHQRQLRERLCRYIARRAVAETRLKNRCAAWLWRSAGFALQYARMRCGDGGEVELLQEMQ
jgi:hypothetical protein